MIVCKRIWFAAAWVALCFLPSLSAWNATGHRIIAAIAYDNLTPLARGRVDTLIRQHPDYQTMFAKGAPEDPVARARAAFLTASVWPDAIRGNDPRFYDELRADAQPTPLLPGFPDMGSHATWHYVDFNFSNDGTSIPPIETPNALGEVTRLIGVIGAAPGNTTADIAAYSLPWILHLVGDVHQPLHTVSRYSRTLPKGDRGGNDVWVRPLGFQPRPAPPGGTAVLGVNLHAYWDGLAGNDVSSANVDRLATELSKEYRARFSDLMPDTHPETWVVEGFYNARSVAYLFSQDNGSREQPIALDKDYEEASQALSRDRLAAAGLRLAAVLNAQLR